MVEFGIWPWGVFTSSSDSFLLFPPTLCQEIALPLHSALFSVLLSVQTCIMSPQTHSSGPAEKTELPVSKRGQSGHTAATGSAAPASAVLSPPKTRSKRKLTVSEVETSRKRPVKANSGVFSYIFSPYLFTHHCR